jgi:hypothetical protein
MEQVNFEKFIVSFIEATQERPRTIVSIPACIKKALKDQGLEYKDGEIVKNQDRIAAELEDEKIRKELIDYINRLTVTPSNIDKYNTWIAWLEKQGQVKEYTFKSIPRLLDMIEPSDRAKAYCQKLIDTLAKEGYNTDVKIVEEVLKGWNGEDVPMAVMDEQKVPVLDFKAKDWYVSKVDGKIRNIYYSIDKPEPKFKAGDWVVLYPSEIEVNRKVVQISRIERCQLNMYWTTEGTWFGDGTDARLWTTQDAKDGDVLYSPEHNLLWIYKNKEECHAAVNLNYANSISFGSDIVIPSDAQQATKLQCDYIFSKMHESGYECDDKEKVVKEVENIWHNYNDPIDVDKTILIIAPNGNSSLALWNGKALLSKTLGGGHNVLCDGDKWAYIEDLIKTQKVV